MYLITLRRDGIPVIVHSDFERVDAAKITRERNAVATLEFTMYPDNPGYDAAVEFATTATVVNLKNGATEFEGRVIACEPSQEDDGSVSKLVTCEDVAGYLNDSRQPYTEERNWAGDSKRTGLQEFVDFILANHNARMPEDKRVYRGTVDVPTFATVSNVTKGTNFERTLDIIADKLVGVFGGEWRVRRGSDGRLYFDYRSALGTVSGTTIAAAHNIQSAKQSVDPDQLITRLYPRGCKLTRTETDEDGTEREVETEERLGIGEANGGREYIDDADAMRLYGIIEGTAEWDDVTDALNLKTKAEKWLEENNRLPVSTEITALDLSVLGIDPDGFALYDWYRCRNPLVGIDETLEIVKQTLDINDPSASTFDLGESTKTQSDAIKALEGLKGDVEYIGSQTHSNTVNLVNAIKYTMSAIEVAEDRIRLTVGEQIVEVSDRIDGEITVIKSRVSTIEQTAGSITLKVEELTEAQDTMRSQIEMLPDQITSTVTEQYKTYVSGEIATVNKSISEVRQTASSIQASVRELKSDQSELQSQLELLPDQITTTVTNGYKAYVDGEIKTVNSSISRVEQTAGSIQSTVQSMQALYGSCNTAASTAAKTVSISHFTLRTGSMVSVWFVYENTASSPTLNVNGTGAKPMRLRGSSAALKWQAGDLLTFVYSGAYWFVADCGSRSSITQLSDRITLEVKNLTSEQESMSSRIDVLSDGINLKVSKGDVSSQLSVESGAVTIKSNRFSWESQYSSMTRYGALTCTNGSIGGFEISSFAISNDSMSLTSDGLTLRREGSLVGDIRSSNAKAGTQYKGLDFDLTYNQSYMAWCYDETLSDGVTTFKVVYAAKAFSVYAADTFNVHCISDFHGYLAKNLWIDPNTGGCNGGISMTSRFVLPASVSSDGTLAKWHNGCYMTFKAGMLIDCSMP